MYVRAGKEGQNYVREAEWKVRVSGTIFYDRDFDGEADTNELLSNSQFEVWGIDGKEIEASTSSDIDGSYEIYLSTGTYKTWSYTTEGTSYVNTGDLKLDEATNLNPSLTKGVNYDAVYLSSETSDFVDFDEIDIEGTNFSFEIGLVDGGIDIILPAGAYNFSAEYNDLSGSDDLSLIHI